MTFNQIKMALYATYITNLFGYKLKKVNSSQEKKSIRIDYSNTLLSCLGIDIKVLNPQLLPKEGQFLLASNHRSVIDPLIIEIALQDTKIFGHWISKKELYNSFFFGLFVKNAGTVLLDRATAQMSAFFADIKKCVKAGDSIYIFPEGSRNITQEVITPFKDGSKIIAVKNRLNILPIYIKNNANEILMRAIKEKDYTNTIEVEVGEIIDYKDKTLSLEQAYKQRFHI